MHSARELIDDIRNGKMIILVDDEDRENEGDIVLAADFVTPEAINFMAKEARGLICLALSPEQIKQLNLPPMVGDQKNLSPNKTAFTVSIEAASGVSTGISASDRSHTIRVAASPGATANDIIMPGHVFPIRAQKGGVLKRAGHTEGSVDLANLAGLNSSAVICEIMKEDGTMARFPELLAFSKQFGLKIGTIESLIEYRLEHEVLVERITQAPLEHSTCRDLQVIVYRNLLDNSHNIAIQKGSILPDRPTLVRVQVESVIGDVFRGGPVDTGAIIEDSLLQLSKVDQGVLLYLRKEGLNSTIIDEVSSWSKSPARTKHKMDPREYGIGAQILRDLGVKDVHLLAQNRPKTSGIKGFGLNILKTITTSEANSVVKSGTEEEVSSY